MSNGESPPVTRPTTRARLRRLVGASLLLLARDLTLAASGGGLTPMWLLRAESVSFGVAAAAGTALLLSSRDDSEVEVRSATVRLAYGSGAVGSLIHVVRLVLYVYERAPRTQEIITRPPMA